MDSPLVALGEACLSFLPLYLMTVFYYLSRKVPDKFASFCYAIAAQFFNRQFKFV